MKRLFSLLLVFLLVLPMGACASQEGGGTMANYLTFASAEPFTIAVQNATKNWDGTLYYSTDTATWNEWDGTTAIASAEHSGEQKIYMRGSGNSVITGGGPECGWGLTGNNIRCEGNIENLLDYEIVANGEHPSMARSCYYHLFSYCTSLTKAPELPATTLATWCYGAMFYGCTSLTKAPELPATTLPTACYADMFGRCTSLKLSATQTDEYITEYRIPSSGIGSTTGDASLTYMFLNTGGTFTGTPSINTTYYLHSSNGIVGSKLSIVTDAVTDTTATVTLSCRKLLYTDVVYRIKAWCYPKGVDYWTAPATWESDLFGGPAHSESVTFEGLLPGTEYEVYAVIYGTDGATEHNATVTFTTAEGGTEPILLLVANQVMGNGFNLYLLTKNLEATDYTAEVTVFTDGGAVAFYGELNTDGSGIDYISVTGLEPLTEYTAAVDIYPSPNGEVVLHGEHTVTTTDEIPVVGYDRDSFLLGFASGLGATAATKDGAEYNSWAQGYIVGCSLRKAL